MIWKIASVWVYFWMAVVGLCLVSGCARDGLGSYEIAWPHPHFHSDN